MKYILTQKTYESFINEKSQSSYIWMHFIEDQTTKSSKTSCLMKQGGTSCWNEWTFVVW
jgi:hypothetical protein